MTYTYTPDFTTQRDRVRLEIGDTVRDPTNKLILLDEEIAQLGTVEGDDLSVAARCCEAIASRYSSKVDQSEGKLSLKLSQRAKAYMEKAAHLRMLAAINGALPSIGGESISDKQANDQDTDRVPPAFWRGMYDNPNADELTPANQQMSDPFDQTG